MRSIIAGLFLCLLGLSPALAVEYRCPAYKKVDSEREYTKSMIDKWKYSTRLVETKDGAFIHRCSHSQTEQKITCDEYKADKAVHDTKINAKKFYVFRSQFNFQIFSDLSSVEDNGRGSIQYGRCSKVKR